ncbi:MAG TPA: hypothetical protein VFM96_05645 [Gaiellaceae bacterium]|nr:hypothetical protein [Gaiellaceae bacterium]
MPAEVETRDRITLVESYVCDAAVDTLINNLAYSAFGAPLGSNGQQRRSNARHG